MVFQQGVGGDEDLPAGAAGEQLLERGQGLVEGQHAVDDRSQDAVVDEPRDGLEGVAVGLDEQEAIGDGERAGPTAQPVTVGGEDELDDQAGAGLVGQGGVGGAGDADDGATTAGDLQRA